MKIHNPRSWLIGEVREVLDRKATRPRLLARPSPALGVLLCAVVLLLCGPRRAGCAEAANQSTAPGTAQSEVEQGPVRLVVQLAPSPARVSDDLTLTVTVHCPPGIAVRKHDVRVAPEDFVVRQSQEVPRRSENGRDVVGRVYALEPARTGRLTVPPVSVSFAQTQPGGSGPEETIRSGAIEVEVTTLVAGVPSLDMLRRPAGPVALPKSTGAPGWLLMVAAAVVAAAAALVWLWARGRPVAAIAGLSPQEEARKGLQRLFDQGGAAASDIKWFYSELTEVVRRYLERTTGIQALEQTTEESLRAVASQRSFPAEAAARLRGLLESADLVKFAAYRPEQNEVDESIRQARFCIELRLGETEP